MINILRCCSRKAERCGYTILSQCETRGRHLDRGHGHGLRNWILRGNSLFVCVRRLWFPVWDMLSEHEARRRKQNKTRNFKDYYRLDVEEALQHVQVVLGVEDNAQRPCIVVNTLASIVCTPGSTRAACLASKQQNVFSHIKTR